MGVVIFSLLGETNLFWASPTELTTPKARIRNECVVSL